MVYEWTGKCRSCQGLGLSVFTIKDDRRLFASAFLVLGLVLNFSFFFFYFVIV